jgi:hypothetical protein
LANAAQVAPLSTLNTNNRFVASGSYAVHGLGPSKFKYITPYCVDTERGGTWDMGCGRGMWDVGCGMWGV